MAFGLSKGRFYKIHFWDLKKNATLKILCFQIVEETNLEPCVQKWKHKDKKRNILESKKLIHLFGKIYGPLAPGMISHIKYPGAFINKCSVWSFWGYLFLCD